jgi:hypothetical protein
MASEGRAKRERVSTTHFEPEEKQKESEELKFEGSGSSLGSIDAIKEAMDKKPSDDDAMIKLHSFCFGRNGKSTIRKKSIRSFNGFATSVDVAAKTDKILANKKHTLTDFKNICDLLCLEKKGTRDEIGQRIMAFLGSPDEDSVSSGGGAKRKSSAKTTKKKRGKKDKSDKPKRKLTNYMNYVIQTRGAVVEENRTMSFAEVAAELGRRWKELRPAEKEKYKVEDTEEEAAAAEEDEDE